MSGSVRVGFQLFGGKQWTGGINYLAGLLEALHELPDRPVEAVLFVDGGADAEAVDRVVPYLSEPYVELAPAGASRAKRYLRQAAALIGGRDPIAAEALRRAGVEVFFHHMVWYGSRVGVPTIAWIPDFQHQRLPHMFSLGAWLRRDVGFRLLTSHSTRVMLSSEDARRDCERYYPASRGRTTVVRFAVRAPRSALLRTPAEVRKRHGLPEKYLFFPGQLWKHKNHLGVVEAVNTLRKAARDVVVVMSGGLDRNGEHAGRVGWAIEQFGLRNHIRVLGHIPYDDMLQVMRGSIAMLNPSFSEGWSTTVEEAKALGVPLLLSSLDVHREQAGELGTYFDPSNPADIAAALWDRWCSGVPGPDARAVETAMVAASERWMVFARTFADLATQVARGGNA